MNSGGKAPEWTKAQWEEWKRSEREKARAEILRAKGRVCVVENCPYQVIPGGFIDLCSGLGHNNGPGTRTKPR